MNASAGVDVVRGSAFVDMDDPLGPLGNPFTVVCGEGVEQWSRERRRRAAREAGTPETVFIDAATSDTLQVMVLTPTGAELGACVHGFMGTVAAAAEGGLVTGHKVRITTSAMTTADASWARLERTGRTRPKALWLVELHLVAAPNRQVDGRAAVDRVFPVPLVHHPGPLDVLSVGSPKLTLEVPPSTFFDLRDRLHEVRHDQLHDLQRSLEVSGVHVFTRSPTTGLPQHSLQVNALLGPELMVDRATGASNAAQVAADRTIAAGQSVRLTQHTSAGPSATITVTKGPGAEVSVTGHTLLSTHGVV